MTQERIFVMDTETTGLDEDRAIVEVSWVEINDSGLAVSIPTVYKVDPGKPINCSAAGVHGIRDEDIAAGKFPKIADVEFPSGPIILVAHNTAFDRPLLEDHCNIVAELCTLRLARRLLPDAPDHKLATLLCYCGLPAMVSHSAGMDVLQTSFLLKYLCQGAEMSALELIPWAAKPLVYTLMPFGKHKGQRMEDVPRSYLVWLSKQDLDMDMRATVDFYLRKEGSQ
jgi:exodeoxyribonuclease X